MPTTASGSVNASSPASFDEVAAQSGRSSSLQTEANRLVALLAPPTVSRCISDITSTTAPTRATQYASVVFAVCSGVRGRSRSLLTYAHGPETSRGSSVATKLDRSGTRDTCHSDVARTIKKTTGASTPIVASTAKLRSRWRNANCRFRPASARV
jgi:hypothetical protein